MDQSFAYERFASIGKDNREFFRPGDRYGRQGAPTRSV